MGERRGSPDAVHLGRQATRLQIQHVSLQRRPGRLIDVDGEDIPTTGAEGIPDGPGAGEELEQRQHFI